MKAYLSKPKNFALYAWGVVAFNLFVIVWGAYVRASGSGAGCGSHWPLCNGVAVPRSPEFETIIEFTHRTTSGLALILVFILAVWAFRAFPKGHLARVGAAASVVFIVIEALIGAVLVLLGLVADNDSVARAFVLGVHLANTFLLIGALALTALWGVEGESSAPRLRGRGPLAWLYVASLAGVIVVGVSGAVAALGDTLFPAGSLMEGIRQDFSETAHILIRLRIMHPALAIAVGALLMAAAALTLRASMDARVRRWASVMMTLVAVQLGAGLLNVFLLAPIWLQMVHLLLADLLWLSLVMLSALALAERERTADERLEVEMRPAEVKA